MEQRDLCVAKTLSADGCKGPSYVSSSCRPVITMMQASEPRLRDYAGGWPWPLVHWSPIRCILLETIVNAVIIVIPRILAKQSRQMALVQWDDAVQHLSTATADHGSAIPFCQGA